MRFAILLSLATLLIVASPAHAIPSLRDLAKAASWDARECALSQDCDFEQTQNCMEDSCSSFGICSTIPDAPFVSVCKGSGGDPGNALCDNMLRLC